MDECKPLAVGWTRTSTWRTWCRRCGTCHGRVAGITVPDLDGFGGGSDSDGFGRIPSSPAGAFLRYCTVCMGISTLQKCVPDSDGFGRESDSDGFGRIPGPQIWKSPTQQGGAGSTEADPIRFRDLTNPAHRFWAISDESDRFWGHFAHMTRSALGLGLLLSFSVYVRGHFAHTIQTDSPIRLAPRPAGNPPRMWLASRNPLGLAR